MPFFRALSLLLCLLFLFACTEKPKQSKKPNKSHLVEVYTVEIQELVLQRERTGTLQSKQEIEVFNQEEGRIISLPFYEGDRVRKGDVIAKLDDRLLRSQLARTQALRVKAQKDVKRIRGLANKQMTAQAELTGLETELVVAQADEQILKTRLEYATIVASIDGVISQRLSESGNIAERYTHLLTISDQSSLTTQVSVSELLINTLQKGAQVDVDIDALQLQEPIKANIQRIHPNLDPLTRTGIVEIALSPVPQGARPGQLARVTLRSQKSKRLMIPFSALRRSSEGEYVFVVDENVKAKKVQVLSGLRIDNNVEVIKGLSEGQKVITRGFTNLRDNKTVVVVPSTPSTLEVSAPVSNTSLHNSSSADDSPTPKP